MFTRQELRVPLYSVYTVVVILGTIGANGSLNF